MKRFAELFQRLDEDNSTLSKVRHLVEYFCEADPRDAAWAAWFLSGRRLSRLVKSGDLKAWAMEVAGVPEWLFVESYSTAGDLAEAISHLVETGSDEAEEHPGLSDWIESSLLPLKNQDPEIQKQTVLEWWRRFHGSLLFIVNKLLTGNFRIGVSQGVLLRALHQATDVPLLTVTRKLMGDWKPTTEFWNDLIASKDSAAFEVSQPYPFYLASPLDGSIEDLEKTLGAPEDWLVEWKWDGIRAQWIYREGQYFLWSRGEELMTERFPELSPNSKATLPSMVLDGEILAVRNGKVMPFQLLQQRISRKKLSGKILDDCPVHFFAYDLLEYGSEDWRDKPIRARRARLESVIPELGERFRISPALTPKTWEEAAAERERSRELGTEGLMLKKMDSPYGSGRRKGAWWKWKIAPWTLDAVLMYAQAGHGQRSGLYTDYTFGLWRGEDLLPIAKAYSGLDQEEIEELDRWIRKNTREKFGPVRSVNLEHVFEIAFEGIAESTRHRSGIALRFPRILRWRRDKRPADANTLADAQELLRVRP